jgi:hypothetical protein
VDLSGTLRQVQGPLVYLTLFQKCCQYFSSTFFRNVTTFGTNIFNQHFSDFFPIFFRNVPSFSKMFVSSTIFVNILQNVATFLEMLKHFFRKVQRPAAWRHGGAVELGPCGHGRRREELARPQRRRDELASTPCSGMRSSARPPRSWPAA